MTVEIQILSGARRGERIELDGDEFTVGGRPECEVYFDSASYPSAADRAARFRVDKEGLSVDNVGSGVLKLNDQQVAGTTRLQTADVVQLSDFGPDFRVSIIAHDCETMDSTPPRFPSGGDVARNAIAAQPTPALPALASCSTGLRWFRLRPAAVVVIAGSLVVTVLLVLLGWRLHLERPVRKQEERPSEEVGRHHPSHAPAVSQMAADERLRIATEAVASTRPPLQALSLFEKFPGPLLAVAISDDGRFAATVTGTEYADRSTFTAVSDTSTRLWDLTTGELLHELRGHTGFVSSVAFSRDGSRLITAGHDRTVRLWDCATGAELTVFAGHDSAVTCAAFSATGDRMASADRNGTVRLWESASGQVLRVFKGHGWPCAGPSNSVRSLTFSSDGNRLLSGGDDRMVQLWDLEGDLATVELRNVLNWDDVPTLLGHSDSVIAVAQMPNPRFAISASRDGTVRIWDLYRGGERFRIVLGLKELSYAAFSADAQMLLAADRSTGTYLWDIRNATWLQRLAADGYASICGALSPDASFALAGGTDWTIRLVRFSETDPADTSLHPDAKIFRTLRIVADSWSEFSPARQGVRNWYYGYTDGSGGDFTPMNTYRPEDRNWGAWVISGTRIREGYPPIHRYGAHPATGGRICVRRWISQVQGPVQISGNLGKSHSHPQSDGITGHILIDGKEIWSQHIAGTDTQGVWYEIAAEVQAGSTVDFAISPGPTHWADTSKFTATVSVVEDGLSLDFLFDAASLP